MRKANVKNATWIAKVQSMKGESKIECLEIVNQITGRKLDIEGKHGGLKSFNDLADLKASLNWCLNCYPEKMSIIWENTKKASYGTVYLVA